MLYTCCIKLTFFKTQGGIHMSVITFLKNWRGKQLLNKLADLEKQSNSYLESAETCAKLLSSGHRVPCSTCNFSACYFNSFLDNTYDSNFCDVFYSNYSHFEYMYIITERKIRKVKKKLEAYKL